MKRILSILTTILILAAAAAGGYWLYRTRLASATGAAATGNNDTFTQIVDVQRGSLTASITVVGELEAVQQADLTFSRLNGSTPLLTLSVSPGQWVEAGTELATVDPTPYQQAVDQARSDLQAAEKKLAELQEPPTALKVAKADLAVAKAEYQLLQAQNALEKLLHPDLAKLQTNVADAQRSLAQAKADLLALENNTATQDQLTRLREAEAAAEAEYSRLANERYTDEYYQDRLRLAYNKLLNARDARITAETQAQINLLKAQMQVRKAEAALADAQAALREAQGASTTDTDTALALAKARLAVRDAEVALAAAQDARAQLDQGPDPVTLAAAQADMDKKRLALADAEAALAATRLTAPFAGTVLQTFVSPGDTIAATTRILALANLDQLQVVAAVDETTIRSVAPDQLAQITFDALPGKTLAGRVQSVPLQGTLQGGVTVYQVPISLEDATNLPLLVGMTANVKILTGQVENALLVPTMALQKVGGLYQVRIPNPADPAQPIAVPVEVGLSDGTYTQIVRGLNPGDQVVVELTAASSTGFNLRGFGTMGFPTGPGQQRPNR